jgi:hypothetical protein
VKGGEGKRPSDVWVQGRAVRRGGGRKGKEEEEEREEEEDGRPTGWPSDASGTDL